MLPSNYKGNKALLPGSNPVLCSQSNIVTKYFAHNLILHKIFMPQLNL